jgi:uncharacterized protein (DUF362 family)
MFLKKGFFAVTGLSIAGLSPRRTVPVPTSTPRRLPGILDFSVPPAPNRPHLITARGTSLPAMLKNALTAAGGMGSFIGKGDRVVLKPNVSFDSPPSQGANTHPELVGTLTELALQSGAREVIVLDNTLGEPRRCFSRSGIGPAVKRAGGTIFFQGERSFEKVNLGGKVITSWPMFKPLLKTDKFINMPIVKQHGLSKLTAAMKNLYGVIGGRRPVLHRAIHESIVDLARFIRPTLVILDAYSVMTKNGPSGGGTDDLIHPHTIALGTDQVALDAYAATLLGLDPNAIGYIKLAHENGLGTMNLKKLKITALS